MEHVEYLTNMSDSELNLSMDTVVQQTPNQVSAAMGECTAVLNMDSGQYFGLNESSAEIWELIDAPKRVSEVCASLKELFQVSDEQCQSEVLAHLTSLVEDGLVEVVDEHAR